MAIRFVALPTDVAARLRNGGPDDHGQTAERHVAAGGEPCRHCLADMAASEPYLIVSHRPFPSRQPYAEQGPIFLHARDCPRGGGAEIPLFLNSPCYIIRGYDADDRIVYGSGRIIETPFIPRGAEDLFQDPRIAYIHVRSATNNCYHCRIVKAGEGTEPC